MWTHRYPFQPSEFTRESIERRGRLALSRALNVGRVIGFVGSGATIAYGRPSWKELVDEAIDVVKGRMAEEPFKRRSAERLMQQLRAIRREAENGQPEKLLLALGTAEELAGNLQLLDKVRRRISSKIGVSRKTARYTATKRLKKIKLTSPALKDIKKLQAPELKCQAQPLGAAVRDLRLNRFLTLNYDLEIEREFARWFRVASSDDRARGEVGDHRSPFQKLCDFDEDEQARNDMANGPDTVVHVDGTKRSVKSVTMTQDNIGDLVNFALHPRSFDAQVFHLHGRCDKPHDMVLTERDYQATYLKSGAQQHTFDEALSAIFSGNEVLFIGVGMDETDMMRPLRQFVSQDRKPDIAKQPVYALLEHRCTLSLKPCKEADDLGKKEELAEAFLKEVREHCQETPDQTGDLTGEQQPPVPPAAKDRIDENTRALELKSQFGVHVLYYGGQRLRDMRLLTKMIWLLIDGLRGKDRGSAAVKRAKEGAEKGTFQPSEAWLTAWQALRGKLEADADPKATDHVWQLFRSDNLPPPLPLTEKPEEYGKLMKWVAAFEGAVGNGSLRVKDTEAAASADEEAFVTDLRALQNFAGRLESEMRSRALQLALEDLASSRDEWWFDWRQVPNQRRARYPIRTPKIASLEHGRSGDTDPETDEPNGSGTEVISRHRPVYMRYRPSEDGRAQDLEAVQALSKLGREIEEKRQAGIRAEKAEQAKADEKGTARPTEDNVETGTATDPDMSTETGTAKDTNTPDQPEQFVGPYRHGELHGLRIIRATSPRGSGKGALLHLLQDFIAEGDEPGNSDPPLLQYIFKTGRDAEPYPRAFLVHLSFSMEFASAIEALRRFFKTALLELMNRHGVELLTFMRDNRLGKVKRLPDNQFFSELKRFLDNPPDLDTSPRRTKNRKADNFLLTFADEEKPPRKVYFDRFVNIAEPKDRQPNRQAHQHRVDRLRHFMELYRDLACWISDGDPDGFEKNRLFVCLSGLDQLCDGEGVAYNPMFRAFFRLMSGCGKKRPNEAPDRMPMDLLLLSGTPDIPIRYLSFEQRRNVVERKIGKSVAAGEYLVSSDGKVALEKWHLLPPIKLDERFWLVEDGVLPEPLSETRQQRELETKVRCKMLEILAPSDKWTGQSAKPGERHPRPYPFLQGLLDESVALSTWAFGAAKLIEAEGETRDEKEIEILAKDLLARLDHAAARSGRNGVMAVAITVMEEKLQKLTWLREIKADRDEVRRKIYPCIHGQTPTADKGPSGSAKAKDRSAEKPEEDPMKLRHEQLEDKTGWVNRQIELAKLVLQHLAVFPMPVEPRVLYGCPEIHDILHIDLRDIWRAQMRKESGNGGEKTQMKEEAERREGDRMRWKSRELAMEELGDTLDMLHDLNWIIKIEPKKSPAVEAVGETVATERLMTDVEAKQEQRQIKAPHYRYTVHAQMRDFLAHQMRLFVPDRGERNFYQVSLYCDQPRDLPTPTQEHYRMFRAIMNTQIAACQRTLWHFYQWEGPPPKDGEEPKPTTRERGSERFIQGFRRRLTNTDNEFDKTLISVHAVPQRIRALYSLLRSGFSIGTISRLSRFDEGPVPDQPYETFRGWLRGLTNAAIGMDQQWTKILDVAGYELDDFRRPVPKLENGVASGKIQEAPEAADIDPDNAGPEAPPDPKTHAIFVDLTRRVERTYDDGEEPPKRIHRKSHVYLPSQPLYRDEIGWLLNERGVISLVQGYLYDAIPLFERALMVMRHASNGGRDDPALHAATRRVRLNLAIAHIDRGNLYRARQIIDDLRLPEGLSPHSGSLVSRIGEGYIGLIDHFSGHLDAARKRYETLIEFANTRRMLRVVSIFNRYRGDLLSLMGKTDDAEEAAKLAINAAMQSEQRDILHAARLGLVSIHSAGSTTPSELDVTNVGRALSFAIEMGVPRLQCESLRVQAEVMLTRGERVMAGQTAARASAVAARCGLRLQKVSALNIYAGALRQRQQSELARAVLLEARDEAERLGFQMRAGEMADQLASFDVF